MAYQQERTNRCAACRTRYPSAVESIVCCLHSPEPSGWCAWCGEEFKKGMKQVFCGSSCSLSYKHDLAETRQSHRAKKISGNQSGTAWT